MLGFGDISSSSIAALPEASGELVTSVSDVTWQFLIDFDRDGLFSGADDVTAYVQTAEWKLGFSKSYQLTSDEATCRLVMNNTDRRFSPEYSGGTYYGKLTPHRFMQVRSISEAGTVIHWTGWMDTIAPVPLAIGEQRATITGRGAKHFYDDTTARVPIYNNARADEILEDLLKEVSLPPSIQRVWRLGITGFGELDTNTILPDYGYFYALETGRSIYPYAGDTWTDESAFNVIYDVVAGEPGRFYFARDGRAIFWNRHHLAGITDSAATITDFTSGSYVYGDDLKNRVIVKNYPRNVSSSNNDTLWTLEEPFTLNPGKERRIRASYKDNATKVRIGADQIQIPNVAAGTLAFTPATASLTVTIDSKGDSTEIILVNNARVDVEITVLTLKGRMLLTYEDQTFEVEDGDSRANYGEREMTLNTGIMSSEILAISVAEYNLALRKDPRGAFKQIQLRPRDDTLRAQTIQYSIGTRINVVDYQTAHNADYFIIGENHRLGAGWLHDATWYLEPASLNSFWKLNTSQLDTETRLSL